MVSVWDQTRVGVTNPRGVPHGNIVPFLGVQEGVEVQLVNRKFARLSRQFVSPGMSNRLSHP